MLSVSTAESALGDAILSSCLRMSGAAGGRLGDAQRQTPHVNTPDADWRASEGRLLLYV